MRDSREFPAQPESVGAARRFVRAALTAGHEGVIDDVVLLTSEVAANVVEHAHTTFGLSVEHGSHRVRVEVSDGSSVIPALRDLAVNADRGRGLLMLERLAYAWGVEQGPNGKTVWFEMTDPWTASDAR